MLSLSVNKLQQSSVPLSTTWLLSECMEAKGKQDLWVRQRPEVLEALREQAIIQSAESSNRIEGVTIPQDRLRPVVLGLSQPRDRSEEEVAGYRKALDWIFTRKRGLAVEPEIILHLHALAQGGVSGDAGHWKQRDNEIIEILPSGERKVRFKPTPARKTAPAICALCDNYDQACSEHAIPPLITVFTFVFDFLCIHPFRDGNGRVSRLLTTLLLIQNDFEVGRYISLERIIEENKSDYYSVLGRCSQGWHEGKNQIVPWWNYSLSCLRRAYEEFAAAVESAAGRPVKSELVSSAILAQIGSFTLGDIRAQVPGVSVPQIKKILAKMKKSGQVTLEGRARAARWRLVHKR